MLCLLHLLDSSSTLCRSGYDGFGCASKEDALINERELAAIVADPSLPAAVRRRLTCPAPRPRRRRPRRRPSLRAALLAPDWLLGWAVIAVAVVATAATTPGRAFIILLVLIITRFIAHRVAVPAMRSRAADRYRRRYRGRFVDPSSIGQPYRRQLARAQQAIRTVLQSPVYRDGAINNAVSREVLAEHEWEIACLLRDATALRSQSALISSAPEAASPAVQRILAQHADVLGLVQDSVQLRVEDLEAYAAEVLAANGEYSAWLLAAAASALNDYFLDLLAQAPAHGRGGQIARLTAEARHCREAFQEFLADHTAAPSLVLPDRSSSDAA
jgi:hypothetical protein